MLQENLLYILVVMKDLCDWGIFVSAKSIYSVLEDNRVGLSDGN